MPVTYVPAIFYCLALAAAVCISSQNAWAQAPTVLQVCLPNPQAAPILKQGDTVPGCSQSISFGVDRVERAQPFEGHDVVRLHIVPKDRQRLDHFIEVHSFQPAWLLRSRRVLQTVMLTHGPTRFIDLVVDSDEDEVSLMRLLETEQE